MLGKCIRGWHVIFCDTNWLYEIFPKKQFSCISRCLGLEFRDFNEGSCHSRKACETGTTPCGPGEMYVHQHNNVLDAVFITEGCYIVYVSLIVSSVVFVSGVSLSDKCAWAYSHTANSLNVVSTLPSSDPMISYQDTKQYLDFLPFIHQHGNVFLWLFCFAVTLVAKCNTHEHSPVCDTRGEEFTNMCLLTRHRRTVDYRGHCQVILFFLIWEAVRDSMEQGAMPPPSRLWKN